MSLLPIVIELCAGSGEWSRPYAESGRYEVIRLDLPQDIRLEHYRESWSGRVRVVLAGPPCTKFAVSGARWMASRPQSELIDALSVVDACYRFVGLYTPPHLGNRKPDRHPDALDRPAASSLQSMRLRRPVHEADVSLGKLPTTETEQSRANGRLKNVAQLRRQIGADEAAPVHHASRICKSLL